ncbi:hypothetical protein BN1044_00759, partial [Hafnia alvei]
SKIRLMDEFHSLPAFIFIKHKKGSQLAAFLSFFLYHYLEPLERLYYLLLFGNDLFISNI